MTALENRQIELEKTSVTRGVERYYEALDRVSGKERAKDQPVLASVLADMTKLMLPHVTALQKEARAKLVGCMTTGTRLMGWEGPILTVPADRISYIVARTVAWCITSQRKHALANKIGGIVNLELRWAQLRDQENERAKDDPPNRIMALKRTAKEINPKSLRKWLKKLDDLETETWDYETRMRLGLVLLGVCLDVCHEFVVKKTKLSVNQGVHKRLVTVELSPAVDARVDRDHRRCAERSPWFVPMVAPPRPYTWDGTRFVGGYYTWDVPLIKTNMYDHTGKGLMEDSVPPVVLRALTAVSQTKWAINAPVLRVAQQALEEQRAEVLPVSPEVELPEYYSDEEWLAMPDEQRGAARNARRIAWDHNEKLKSKRRQMHRCLQIAHEMQDEEAIYFPHNLDFRGRAYPMPQDLHPQGDDFTKSLLTFADRKPLGQGGLKWLAYHVATTFGNDKMTRDDQMDWVVENLDAISTVATDPLGEGYAFWTQAEEPWQFLAACIEIEAAFASPDGPQAYRSSLPVFVDGSCNGLQHLSAMGLDPVGAHATNLTADPERQDIYQIVADKVDAAVREPLTWCDHGRDGPAEAIAWDGHVNRKVVKRGVMTVPYGLTSIGMRDQLIEDGWCNDLDGDRMKNAAYLRDLMQDAIADTVTAAVKVMAWMQDNATILSEESVPCRWTTPSGFRVTQAYTAPDERMVRTVVGETRLLIANPTGAISKRKQALSIAPNIVHSFDAAHLTLTVALAAEYGVDSFAVIHDSFGAHAADMDKLGRALRLTFVDIYEQDWFASLQAEFQAAVGPDVPLIQPPKRGDFDIRQVLDADFFFA